MFRIHIGLVWCALLNLAWSPTVAGQNPQGPSTTEPLEFKIETEVFGDDPQSPVSRNLTLFSENLVFDFRFSRNSAGEPDEITIFDSSQRNFILLDSKRKTRLKIDNLQLLRILDGMGKDLKENGATGYLVFGEFQEDYQSRTNRVTVSNDFISYSAAGERPINESILKLYFEFVDHYTLLSVTDPRRMPPFARLQLNNAVKKYGFIPAQISLIVKPSDFNSIGFEAASRHRVKEELDSGDQKLIANARKNWAEFRQVDLAEYRGLETAGASKPGRKRK